MGIPRRKALGQEATRECCPVRPALGGVIVAALDLAVAVSDHHHDESAEDLGCPASFYHPLCQCGRPEVG